MTLKALEEHLQDLEKKGLLPRELTHVDVDDREAESGGGVLVSAVIGLMGMILEVEIQSGTLTVIGENAECSGAVATIEGQWAGPLEPPA